MTTYEYSKLREMESKVISVCEQCNGGHCPVTCCMFLDPRTVAELYHVIGRMPLYETHEAVIHAYKLLVKQGLIKED